jgi:hypothetical protein
MASAGVCGETYREMLITARRFAQSEAEYQVPLRLLYGLTLS